MAENTNGKYLDYDGVKDIFQIINHDMVTPLGTKVESNKTNLEKLEKDFSDAKTDLDSKIDTTKTTLENEISNLKSSLSRDIEETADEVKSAASAMITDITIQESVTELSFLQIYTTPITLIIDPIYYVVPQEDPQSNGNPNPDIPETVTFEEFNIYFLPHVLLTRGNMGTITFTLNGSKFNSTEVVNIRDYVTGGKTYITFNNVTVLNNASDLTLSVSINLVETYETIPYYAITNLSIVGIIDTSAEDPVITEIGFQNPNTVLTKGSDIAQKIINMPTQWFGTSSEFRGITNKDSNTLYFVFED